MRKIIGIILIVGGLVLGFYGYNQHGNAVDELKSLGSKIGEKVEDIAEKADISVYDDSDAKNRKIMSYITMGGGVLVFIIGVGIVVKKQKALSDN